MKFEQSTPDHKHFYSFLKRPVSQQTELLRTEGILLDTDIEKDYLINLYYIKGFFVEETFSISQKRVIENIPFKQGYRFQNYFETKNVIVPKRSGLFNPLFLN